MTAYTNNSRQESFLERLKKANELLKKTVSDIHNQNDNNVTDNVTIESFKLNFGNNATPIYKKIIKSTENNEELGTLKAEFLKYTEDFRKSMENIRIYAEENGFDSNIITMCSILERRHINIGNYWKNFERKVPEYLRITNYTQLIHNLRNLCVRSLSDLINTFPFDYCLEMNNKKLSKKIITAFNSYLENLGISTVVVNVNSPVDYDFYEVNEDSVSYITNDIKQMDMVSNIHHYAYVFADSESEKHIIAKGDASVYCYQR